MKVRDIIKRLNEDGWYLDRQAGSHRVLKHPTGKGVVVVAGHPGKDLPMGTVKHIYEQAGWEDRP